jgi:glycosyltransferase involved in cell wall biosynthesis
MRRLAPGHVGVTVRAPSPPGRSLVWLYPGRLDRALDAATWLETARELRGQGWDVTLLTAGPRGPGAIRGVAVHGIPRPEVYILRQVLFHLRCLRLIVSHWPRTDVVLFHPMSALWILPLRLARRLARGARPLLVMDTRTLYMVPEDRMTWRDRLLRAHHRLATRAALALADGQLTITGRMATALGIPPERLWGTWPSGVNPALFAPAQAIRRWPSPSGPIELVYVGVLHHERNLSALARAVRDVSGEGLPFRLTIVGDGSQRPELEQLAAQHPDCLRVLPPVPHDQVWRILGAAHVGVLPFVVEEKSAVSSYIKLFEYMAAGLPLLSTRVPGNLDVVGPDNYAVWADRADVPGLREGLRRLWDRRDALPRLGREAARASAAWTWSSTAARLSRALAQGIERRRSPEETPVEPEPRPRCGEREKRPA